MKTRSSNRRLRPLPEEIVRSPSSFLLAKERKFPQGEKSGLEYIPKRIGILSIFN
jgi:hypothetical protein